MQVYRKHKEVQKALQDGSMEVCSPKVCILSVDGGGVRGAVPAEILRQLELVLQQEVQTQKTALLSDLARAGPAAVAFRKFLIDLEPAELRVAPFFDVMAGTSTGGLIVTMAAVKPPGDTAAPFKTRYTAADVLTAYKELSQEVFPRRNCIQNLWYGPSS